MSIEVFDEKKENNSIIRIFVFKIENISWKHFISTFFHASYRKKSIYAYLQKKTAFVYVQKISCLNKICTSSFERCEEKMFLKGIVIATELWC